MIALAAAMIFSGSMAFAADILKPATPSLTAPAGTTPAAPEATGTPATAPGATQQPQTATSSMPAAPIGDGLKLSTKPSGPEAVPPKDIPDVLMAEMKDVESSCEKNYFYSSFHDCKCIAVKFIDARMKSDPSTTKDRVFNSISNECVDEAGVAGYIYRSCGDYMQHKRTDYVDFCKCTANKVAASFAKTPVMSLRVVESLRRQAFIDCGIRDKVDKPEKPIPKKYQ